MAYYFFTEKIDAGEPITVFNNGEMSRDFTFIDDIVDGIVSIVAKHLGQESYCSYVNLGNNRPEKLMTFISELENALGKKALINFEPAQAEEMIDTWADIDLAAKLYAYQPKTTLREGLNNFVKWYKDYKQKSKVSS
jgi:UDP-glucuronate 4-epimerase